MRYPQLYNMIFSDSLLIRLKRHFLFWLAVFLYHLIRIGLMYPPEKLWTDLISLLEITFFRSTLLNVLFSYTIVYFLIPRYFQKKKYSHFVIGLILAISAIQILSALYQVFEMDNTARDAIGSVNEGVILFRAGIIRTLGNPPLICCFLLALKALKNWHLEQLKTETLSKENASAEIQLLKAQVHPHFLFNTLNNIYSFSLSQSPQAGILVKKLSGLLGYMVHECDQLLVPLEKELKLIQDYIGLEKVRYGNRLKLHVEIDGDYENKLIAPLLMISFVENCFKHGVSVMRGQQWIKLSIYIKDDQLIFNLSNSKPPQTFNTDDKKGIGLVNVQKRLKLLYPGNHSLTIESRNDTFVVLLEVCLQQCPVVVHTHELIPTLQLA